jgi:hypothetical protein
MLADLLEEEEMISSLPETGAIMLLISRDSKRGYFTGSSNPLCSASKSLIYFEKIRVVKLCGDFRGLAAELTAAGH